MKTADIRQLFLDFFIARGHTEVASAPLLYNDPTLLFVNAGMVPFKPYLTGQETPPFKRAVSVQKCVRTLDIEEVGKTTRHGTFFQMCGNFAFADYFKQGAISFAWDLVTGSQSEGGFGFDPEKVWVTVYLDDDEAADLWLKQGVPAERIQRRGLMDNYWHMGVPGPGGPCSEIYIDRGPEYGAEGGPIVDEDRYLEIWNLVFQTQELSAVRAKDDFDVRGDLPANNIDTGLGLERVALLLQGVDNMYEIDEVFPVIDVAADLAGKSYGDGGEDDVRLRVVGDHVRSSLMLMTDGVTPGNEGRGYVLRRLLRRSVRMMRLLGVREPVLPTLLPVSKEVMAPSWPDVAAGWERVSQVAYAEEEAFRRTLSQGTQIFDTAVSATRKDTGSAAQTLSAERAFALHDTYGFPIDLTLEMASEQGLAVDRAGFDALMSEQRDRAKADARSKKGGTASVEAYRTLRDRGENRFVGYEQMSIPASVRGLVRDGQLVDTAGPGDTVEVILPETPFYAESGGQDADTGRLLADGLDAEVVDVQRPIGGLIVHKVVLRDGELHTGQELEASVDVPYRMGACRAHSATHLIHAALREYLGPTAVQAGSYNKPGYLRFDFSSGHGLSHDLKQQVEGRVNLAIRDDLEVTANEMALDEAKAMGAMAMFGEKYGDVVRMVEMGGEWSRELCGGTHVQRASQIGLLSLLGEQSVGSGVRRVEALVSTDAFDQLAGERALVASLTDMLKVQPGQLAERVAKVVAELKNAERQIADLKTQQAMGQVQGLVDAAHEMWGVAYVSKVLPGVSGGDLRTLAVEARQRLGERPAVVCLIGGTPEKAAAVVATNDGARRRELRAGALVGAACAALGGKGGGKDDLAQGGGSRPEEAEAALTAVEHAIGHVLQG